MTYQVYPIEIRSRGLIVKKRTLAYGQEHFFDNFIEKQDISNTLSGAN
jgi:hypothetical protein